MLTLLIMTVGRALPAALAAALVAVVPLAVAVAPGSVATGLTDASLGEEEGEGEGERCATAPGAHPVMLTATDPSEMMDAGVTSLTAAAVALGALRVMPALMLAGKGAALATLTI